MTKSTKKETIKFGPLQLPWEDQVPFGVEAAPPTKDPNKTYVSVPPKGVGGDFPVIDYALFEIPANAMSDDQRTAAVNQLKKVIKTQHANFMGFQANQDESYSDYAWLLDMHVNNIGDPFTGGLFTLNSKVCERAVLDYFASMWNIDWPHTEGDKRPSERYWGYILSMGFTEGNIYGLFNARDYLKGRMLIQQENDPEKNIDRFVRGKEIPVKQTVCLSPCDDAKKQPILFFSEDAHYSIVKSGRILEISTFCEEGNSLYPGQCPITQHLHGAYKGKWPDGVPSHAFDTDNPESGQVNVAMLKALVEFFVEKDYPVIIVLNVGSTWKGAYDDVPAVNDMLVELGERYPELWQYEYQYRDENGKTFSDIRRRFWVHVDGALGAAYLPFLEMAYNQNKIEDKPVQFDFRNDVVMSIGCSLHKWFGFPVPSGVFLTRTQYQLQPPAKVGYIGSPDTTLGGSRSGLSPILVWDYFSRMSYTDNMMKALKCENVSKYFLEKLKALEKELQQQDPKVDLWIARSKMALTVRFRMVNPTITYKYTIDNERMYVPISNKKLKYQERSFSHVYFMHFMGHGKADELIRDIREACKNGWHGAFPLKDGDMDNPGAITVIEASADKE
ncbi:MAG: histidine decarboxylase [Methylobacter sp.]|nr:histidine decarboxylase [Methylobacter sp.]